MKEELLKLLGIEEGHAGASSGNDLWFKSSSDKDLPSINPATGEVIATVKQVGLESYEKVIAESQKAFEEWRMVPAPKRGELIRELGEELRRNKEALGKLVSLEVGKIYQEGLGEVQEMIDICDFAVGLSRQLYGLTIASERPKHRMFEQWHPLGPVGVITTFNFPVAVWAWNAAIAAVCGDTIVWKPSPKAPLTAIAVQNICNRVMEKFGYKGIFNLVIGDIDIGKAMADDRRLPLISATGSVRMGKAVGQAVAARLGRSILELGGNNAVIIDKTADLDLALRAVLFGAVGTAGQRCTTTRRLIIHEEVADKFIEKLIKAYKQVKIGDPLDPETLMGPLIDAEAVENMMKALEIVQKEGGKVLYGGEKLDRPGFFVTPAIVKVERQYPIVKEETFAPILYVMTFRDISEAIALQNDVPQGLSSAIFTRDLLHSEQFLSPIGSDCGIANVNIGTSGAEIGGAFGGEKETGGGREAGSDAWKAYMRRQTNTINWSLELPLAQGIKFGDFSD